jgi:hypothetical protein
LGRGVAKFCTTGKNAGKPGPCPSGLDRPVFVGGRERPYRDFLRETHGATAERPADPAFHDPQRLAVESELARLAGPDGEMIFIPGANKQTVVGGPNGAVRLSAARDGGVVIDSENADVDKRPRPAVIAADTPPEEREYRLKRALGLPVPREQRRKYDALDRQRRSDAKVGRAISLARRDASRGAHAEAVPFCQAGCGCPSCLPSPAGWDAYAASTGFTGEKKDSRGRRICYANGKRVACPKKPGAAKQAPAGAAPAKAPPADLDALKAGFDRAGSLGVKNSEVNALTRRVLAMPEADAKALWGRLGRKTAQPDYRRAAAKLIADRRGAALRIVESGSVADQASVAKATDVPLDPLPPPAPKVAPRPRKAPADLDALHTEVQDFHARGGDGAALAGKLNGLTVPQLKELHTRLGRAVPSYKDALVQSLAVKAVVKARAARQPKAAPLPLSDAAKPQAARLAAVIGDALDRGVFPDADAALAPLEALPDAEVRAVAVHVGATPKGRTRKAALAALRDKLGEARRIYDSIAV